MLLCLRTTRQQQPVAPHETDPFPFPELPRPGGLWAAGPPLRSLQDQPFPRLPGRHVVGDIGHAARFAGYRPGTDTETGVCGREYAYLLLGFAFSLEMHTAGTVLLLSSGKQSPPVKALNVACSADNFLRSLLCRTGPSARSPCRLGPNTPGTRAWQACRNQPSSPAWPLRPPPHSTPEKFLQLSNWDHHTFNPLAPESLEKHDKRCGEDTEGTRSSKTNGIFC